MGFMDAMKNNLKNSLVGHYGLVESPDFPACYLSSSDINNGKFYIATETINSDVKQYDFTKSDIEIMKFVCSGESWVRYWIRFKDGKTCFLTSGVKTPNGGDTNANGKMGGSVYPIERMFGDIITI